jgi:hypothetical protein
MIVIVKGVIVLIYLIGLLFKQLFAAVFNDSSLFFIIPLLFNSIFKSLRARDRNIKNNKKTVHL